MSGGDDTVATELCAVVCDDDPVNRGVVSDLITERGGRVIAETDRAFDAIDLIDRFEPGLVVCDMALAVGSGMDVIEFLAGRHAPCKVIVFTAFTELCRPVEGFSVRVVSKPDFERLEQALDDAIRDASQVAVAGERRRTFRPRPTPGMRQPTGVDDPAEFYRHLAEAERGDTLLSIRVEEEEVADVVRALRAAVRVQDLLIQRHDRLVVLLTGGGSDGPPSVLRRLERTHPTVAGTASVAEIDPAVKPPTEAFMDLDG